MDSPSIYLPIIIFWQKKNDLLFYDAKYENIDEKNS